MLLLTSGRTNDPKLPGSLQFEIRNAGITVKGHFREWQHEVRFDPSNLSGSSLEGKAVVASVATGIENRDEHLQTRQYFHAAVHPYIVMRSRNLQH
ncbi:MAG TPA: YceI family protein, partial [Lacibacter sp.]|nr:YceI family protein [Lacibacter sp.]